MKKNSFIKKIIYLTCTAAAVMTPLHAEESVNEQAQPKRAKLSERTMNPSEYLAIQEERAKRAKEDGVQYAEQDPIVQDKTAGVKISQKAMATDYYTSHSGAFHRIIAIGILGETIETEDGAVWGIYSGHRHRTLDWLSTDTILIKQNTAWFSTYKYRLVNQNTGASVEADLVLAPLYVGPYSHWVTAIDVVNRFVWLEDGSRWHISAEDARAFNFWKLNDTVIIGVNDSFFAMFTPNILINVTYSASYVHAKCEN